MKNLSIIVSLVYILVSSTAFVPAQESPAWVENNGISPWVSENTYVTGYGIATITKKDEAQLAQKQAEENAKKNLAEKILVQVKSSTRMFKQQTGNAFEQKLESEIISLSDIELIGLQKECYIDEKKEFAYSFVYVKKAFLIESYGYKIEKKEKELESLFFNYKEFENRVQKDKSL
jgi:hypothetical protein